MINRYINILIDNLSQYDGFYSRHKKAIDPRPRKLARRKLAEAGVLPYSLYCASAIRNRAKEILTSFGLVGSGLETAPSDSWREFFHSPTRVIRYEGERPFSEFILPGPAWHTSGYGHIKSLDCSQPSDGSLNTEPDLNKYEFTDDAKTYLAFIFNVVEATTWLSFTNWDISLRSISQDFIDQHEFWWRSLVSDKPLMDVLSEENFIYSFNDIADATMEIAVAHKSSWSNSFERQKTIAFHHAGVVFCNARALASALDLDACFLHVVPGFIMTENERYGEVVSISWSLKEPECAGVPKAIGSAGHMPVDMFRTIGFADRMEISNQQIKVARTTNIDNKVINLSLPAKIFGAIVDSYVTAECEHHYYSAMSPRDDMSIHNGLDLTCDSPHLWLQAVDQNPVGQQIAYQNAGEDPREGDNILLRHCCLNCVLDRLQAVGRDELEGSRIIFGRLPGEEME